MPPRIAIITVGHPDYPNDVGEYFALEAGKNLARQDVEIVWSESSATNALAAATAGRAALKTEPEGIIIFIATWLECSTAMAALREIEHLPFAIWATPMYELNGKRESTGSFVAACALKPALLRMGYRFKTIIGLPGMQKVEDEAVSFCYAAHTTERLKRDRLGLIGYSAMSIYPGTFDHVLLRRYIGPEVVHLDTYTLLQAVEEADPKAVAKAEAKVCADCSVEVAQERLTQACGLAAAADILVKRHHLQAMNVKCQYELSKEYGMTACLPMALLADQNIVASCEGDVMVTVSQMLLHHLTGQVTTYGDILDIKGKEILISSCGFAPLTWAHQPQMCCIRELDYPGFNGIICSFSLKQGPVTFARLAEGRGDYYMVYGLGEGIPTELRQGRFPALQIVLDGDPMRLLEHMPSQHFALCHGHVGEEIEDTCRILGIEAIRI